MMPDRHGWDANRPKARTLFRPGDVVYVVELDSVWQALFVGYKDGAPYVQRPGGEILPAEPGTLRRAS